MKTPVTPELKDFPCVALGHYPTPLELLPRISETLPGVELWVKRDDCTGLGMGGNKVRQLEFYLGDALSKGCDTVLSTGAVQSNYMRTLAAAAAKLGIQCHIQLEDRVKNDSPFYRTSGNRLLVSLFGASVSTYPEGEDEQGADREIRRIADQLESRGRKPYVIPLGLVPTPKGALGYVECATEIHEQFSDRAMSVDHVVVPSGSGLTHAGTLFGLRLRGNPVPVTGACVRRPAADQVARITAHCENLARMIGIDNPVAGDDIVLDDRALAPGYGKVGDHIEEAIHLGACQEGLLLDPVYSAKAFACLLDKARKNEFGDDARVLFIHTGGTPALFAYHETVQHLSEAEHAGV